MYQLVKLNRGTKAAAEYGDEAVEAAAKYGDEALASAAKAAKIGKQGWKNRGTIKEWASDKADDVAYWWDKRKANKIADEVDEYIPDSYYDNYVPDYTDPFYGYPDGHRGYVNDFIPEDETWLDNNPAYVYGDAFDFLTADPELLAHKFNISVKEIVDNQRSIRKAKENEFYGGYRQAGGLIYKQAGGGVLDYADQAVDWHNANLAGTTQDLGSTADAAAAKRFFEENPNYWKERGVNDPTFAFDAQGNILQRGDVGAEGQFSSYMDTPLARTIPERENYAAKELARQAAVNEELKNKAAAQGFKFNLGGEVPMMDDRKPKKIIQKDRYGNQLTFEFPEDTKPVDPTKLMEKMMTCRYQRWRHLSSMIILGAYGY